MPFSIGPKTILSLIGAALLIGGGIYLYVLITNLRATNATLTAQNQQLQANILVEQSARQAAEKAAADLQKAKDDADKAIADANAARQRSDQALALITQDTENAPDSDKVCNAPALWTAVDRLFAASAGEGGSAGRARGQGQGPAGASFLQGLAGRTTVTIRPSR